MVVGRLLVSLGIFCSDRRVLLNSLRKLSDATARQGWYAQANKGPCSASETQYLCQQHWLHTQDGGCKLKFTEMPETLDSVSRQRQPSIWPQPVPYGIGCVCEACLDAEALVSEGDLLAWSLMHKRSSPPKHQRSLAELASELKLLTQRPDAFSGPPCLDAEALARPGQLAG